MYCPKCGTQNQDSAKLCISCKCKLKQSEVGAVASIATGSVTGAGLALAGVNAGAAAGTAGAAAFTSGLATVGSIVGGGGMLAGIGIVAVAPIAFGAAGYGTYKLYKHLATKK
ncbi:hypothetical protein R83H12_00779 [Fibrobacteria bacterium R8-3-H12]